MADCWGIKALPAAQMYPPRPIGTSGGRIVSRLGLRPLSRAVVNPAANFTCIPTVPEYPVTR